MGSTWESLQDGTVHRVRRGVVDGRRVIEKALGEPLPAPSSVASMLREAEILGELGHVSGIGHLVEVRRDAGIPRLLLQDCGPETLGAYIQRVGPLGVERFLELAVELTRQLAGVHAADFLHRDLTPTNIVLDDTGPHIVDFGLATRSPVSAVHSLVGTPAWMAPEQTGRVGLGLDVRADLYSLGACFFYMLAGSPPFTMRDRRELVHAHLTQAPPALPGCPEELERLVLGLLAKDPGARPQTASTVLAALTALQGRPPDGAGPRPRRVMRPSRLWGRASETRTLRDRFAAAPAGRGGVVLVTGEAEVGKTALTGQLRRQVALAGGFIGVGPVGAPMACWATALNEVLDQLADEPGRLEALAEALGPFRGAVATLMPRLDAGADVSPGTDRLSLLKEGLRRTLIWLSKAAAPLVLVLEDQHLADSSGMDLLQAVRPVVQEHGILVVLTAERSDAPSVLARIGKVDELIRLLPLDAGGCAQLCADVLGAPLGEIAELAATLHTSVGGRPGAVLDALHRLCQSGLQGPAWALPADARLQPWSPDDLDDDSLAMLRQAAVLGSTFSVVALAELLGADLVELTRRLARAGDVGLVRPSGRRKRPRSSRL